MSKCLEVMKFKDPKLGTRIAVDRQGVSGPLCLVLAERNGVSLTSCETWKDNLDERIILNIESNPFKF